MVSRNSQEKLVALDERFEKLTVAGTRPLLLMFIAKFAVGVAKPPVDSFLKHEVYTKHVRKIYLSFIIVLFKGEIK